MRGSERAAEVWLRRCSACGADDVRSAFARPEMLGDDPWRCPRCGAPRWRAARHELPARSVTGGRCPFLDAPR